MVRCKSREEKQFYGWELEQRRETISEFGVKAEHRREASSG